MLEQGLSASDINVWHDMTICDNSREKNNGIDRCDDSTILLALTAMTVGLWGNRNYAFERVVLFPSNSSHYYVRKFAVRSSMFRGNGTNVQE